VTVQIPGKALDPNGPDISAPAVTLLQDLNLLGKDAEDQAATGFVSAFTGPPQSVAVIEAGATAAAKWWAAGGAAAVGVLWGKLYYWWGSQPGHIQDVALWGAAIVTAAAVVAIGYLLASDVRGRAAASVAIVTARATVATSMICAVKACACPPGPRAAAGDAVAASTFHPLPNPVAVRNSAVPEANEPGWLAIGILRDASGNNSYLIVKGSDEDVQPASKLVF
jgi:hypothetical protein